ncbi:molybdenum cofactor guanylyltransferase [Caldisericum exile]|uniref:Probable molybdenum cofactor guanylyltransferase n=1 Tax=Caldisericum exile (strain DSM 21853 / NBRC 104410 / AZM16c01) TaxID=511051 RepID=A0A7U6GF81_CALEA|nr:molybdenum cofactor guanylyltransferase [Caldisericum exile]BAL81317.1 molybdopterin-guanine dinucleotide biosynthesis protein A [Caldisericum exile AZM16c01]
MNTKPVILVGGKSRRFGSDKFFLTINGNLIFERTYRILKDVFQKEPVFVGRQAPIKNYEFIEDLIPNLGPIGGLYTAFNYFNTDFVFLTACDMPFINREVLKFMMENLDRNTYACVPKLENGYIEPLFAFYSKKLLPKIERNIEVNNLKLRSLLDENVQYVYSDEIKSIDPELLTFLNINTKNDFDKICKILENEKVTDFAF